MKTHTKTRSQTRGFTLLELIVVITIIGLLGTLVVVNVGGVIGRANETKIKHDLQSIVDAATMYRSLEGYYPETIEELSSGTTAEGGRAAIKFDRDVADPWGNPYVYEIDPGTGDPRAFCLGKDQVEGGQNDDQDYYYPELDEGAF